MPRFGAYADGVVYRPRQTIKIISAAATQTGAVKSTYEDNKNSNIRTNEGIVDLGPVTDVYDPEWNAWLAGEV